MPDTPQIAKKHDTVTINGIVTTDALKASDTLVTVSGTVEMPKEWYQNDGNKLMLTLGVTLILFFLGQIFTIWWKKYDKRNLLVNSKVSLETWVLLLEGSVLTMLEHCKTFNQELLDEKVVQRVSLSFTPTLVRKISELDITDFQTYTIFFLEGKTSENAERAYNINQNIEIIKEYETEIKKQYERFLDDVDKTMDELNTSHNAISDTLIRMLFEVANVKENIAYEFSHNVNDLSNNFNQIEDRNVEAYQTKYIPAWFKILEEEMGKNPKNPYTPMFTPLVARLAVAFGKWKQHQLGYATVILDFGERYSKAYSNLKKDIQALQNDNVVNAWFVK